MAYLTAINSSWNRAEEQIIQSPPAVFVENFDGFSLINKTFNVGTHGNSEVSETEETIPKFMEMNEFAERSVSYDRAIMELLFL